MVHFENLLNAEMNIIIEVKLIFIVILKIRNLKHPNQSPFKDLRNEPISNAASNSMQPSGREFNRFEPDLRKKDCPSSDKYGTKRKRK